MKKFISIGLAALIVSAAMARGVGAQNQDVLVGTWEMTTVSPEGERPNTMIVSKEGDTLKAVAKSEAGERPYDSVALKGSDVTIVLTISYNGSPMVITYVGKLEKGKMGGTADFGGLAEGTWSAIKK